MKIIIITNMGRIFTRVVGNGAVKDLELRDHMGEEVVEMLEVKP